MWGDLSIVIDGNKIRSREELHMQFKEDLLFPDYYGANLDALWDCLTGYNNDFVKVEWLNFHNSRITLGHYADKVLAVLVEAPNVTVYISE